MAQKKKLIELIINQFTEKFGVQAISLVELPAIESDWVYLSNDNFLSLAKIDEEQRILVGAVLIPEKRIPRYDAEKGEEYEVYFTAETIAKAEELYMKNLRGNNATYEHEVDIEGLSVIESWISEDKVKDKSSLYGFNMPVGTWFVKMKVENNDVWNKVKSGEVRGFSIEGYFVDRVEEMSKEILPLTEDCKDCLDETTLKQIGKILLEELMPVKVLDGEPLFKTKEEAELYAETIKGCKGFHPHSVDGEKLFMPCETHDEATKVELLPIKILDGEPLFKTSREAEKYAETVKGCKGFHPHTIDGEELFMPCYTHEDAKKSKGNVDEFRNKKKKRKKRYKMLKYISFLNRNAIKKYDLNECIKDMKREFGNRTLAKEGKCKGRLLADCVCKELKNNR